MDLVTLVGKRACAGDSPVSLMPALCSHFPEGSRRQTFPLPPPPLMPSPLCTLSHAFRVPCLWPLLFVASPSGAQWRLLRLGSVCGEGVRAELSAWAPRRLQAGRGSLRAANRDCAQESRLRGALWLCPVLPKVKARTRAKPGAGQLAQVDPESVSRWEGLASPQTPVASSPPRAPFLTCKMRTVPAAPLVQATGRGPSGHLLVGGPQLMLGTCCEQADLFGSVAYWRGRLSWFPMS